MDLKYKIILIEKIEKFENLEKIEGKNLFLQDSVSDKISIYKFDEYQKIYSIFGFDFLVEKEIGKTNFKSNLFKKNDDTIYHCYYSKQELSDVEISKILRDSTTLQISENNSYDSDIKFVVCEKGFLWQDKYNFDNTDKFEKALLLFLIALAYNEKSAQILKNVSNSYKKSSYNEMIKTRNEIYNFDLNCFFTNPVKQNRHQLYDIWSIIEKNYHVVAIHNEIKMQVVELTNIIETIKKDKFARNIAIIGVCLGVLSLISAMKDFKELFGF